RQTRSCAPTCPKWQPASAWRASPRPKSSLKSARGKINSSHRMHRPTAEEMIRALELKPHPEGGHYRETFRDSRQVDGRPASTAILFLLARGERSHWHRVDAVEIWHYYAGAPLMLEIAASERGPIERVTLGADLAA